MTQLYKLSNDLLSIQSKLDSGELSLGDVEDTLEGLEGEFESKVESLIHFIKNQEVAAAALKAESDAFKKRADSAKSSIDKVSKYLVGEMKRLDKRELKAGNQSVKFRKPSQVLEITDDVPDEYNLPAKLVINADKNLIKSDIKAGKEIAFAKLVDGEQKLIIS